MVVFATGFRPVIPEVRNATLDRGRWGIIVSDALQTSVEDIYAAGDCVQFRSGITGRPVQGKLATNAVPMAKVLGFNLLGQHRTYSGFYNGAATRVADRYVGGTGLTENAAGDAGLEIVCGHGKVTTQFPILPEAKELRVKLVVEKSTRRLVGGQVSSGEPVCAHIDLLTFAIQRQATVEELAGLSYSAQPYQSFFPAANGIVLAAEAILSRNGW
jgi:NADPH-dependent 2,4-dienoyl-CoA reductase/sulfur reductase-like enzyme